MFHVIWYVIIGFIAGVIAKSVMHMHMTLAWTIHPWDYSDPSSAAASPTCYLAPPTNPIIPRESSSPRWVLILFLFICFKLNIHFPGL